MRKYVENHVVTRLWLGSGWIHEMFLEKIKRLSKCIIIQRIPGSLNSSTQADRRRHCTKLFSIGGNCSCCQIPGRLHIKHTNFFSIFIWKSQKKLKTVQLITEYGVDTEEFAFFHHQMTLNSLVCHQVDLLSISLHVISAKSNITFLSHELPPGSLLKCQKRKENLLDVWSNTWALYWIG